MGIFSIKNNQHEPRPKQQSYAIEQKIALSPTSEPTVTQQPQQSFKQEQPKPQPVGEDTEKEEYDF